MQEAVKVWFRDWGTAVQAIAAVASAVSTVLLFLITLRYVKHTSRLVDAQIEPQVQFYLEDGESTFAVTNTGAIDAVNLRLIRNCFRFFSSSRTGPIGTSGARGGALWTGERLRPGETQHVSLKEMARIELITGENERKMWANQVAEKSHQLFNADEVKVQHAITLRIEFHRPVDQRRFSSDLRFALGPGPDGTPYFMPTDFMGKGTQTFDEYLRGDPNPEG